MKTFPKFEGILFDLDGTLIHTEPAITLAINDLRKELGIPSLTAEEVRPHISYGATRMAEVFFQCPAHHPSFNSITTTIRRYCLQRLNSEVNLFDGIAEILDFIENKKLPWGIVTNRYRSLTYPLLTQLKLHQRAACVVCGDTLTRSKPHPDPLLHACQLINKAPGVCLYIGDARTDIEAGIAAQMTTLAAVYGYLPLEENPLAWGANGLIHTPQEILTWL